MMSPKKSFACLMVLCGFLGMLLFVNDNIYTELTFSRESGFYEEPFELEIYAPPGTEIFYTLDGSDPDENAIKYVNPIKISDATENENVYSMRTDVSAEFLPDDIALYSVNEPDPHYAVPDYNVDKCTVVKSIYRDAEGNFSEIKTGNYFIDYETKTGYQNLNIISIVTDPSNLFDYEKGIYVLGQKYDERETASEVWIWLPANYQKRGIWWERTANIQFFDFDGNLILDKTGGIRIQGQGSRAKLPKSMNIFAREEYDGEGRFYTDLFHTGYMPDAVTLSAGGNDYKTKLRDAVMAGLVEGRNFTTMNYIPYAMFLNGEYWGNYWLTEKYDDAYLGYYYGVEKNNVIMVKAGLLAEGEDADLELYEEMIDYVTNTDLSDDINYEYACKLIDIQSYIDYYAAEIYIARCGDWPVTNEGLWRVRETDGTEYGDGKWRWMLYDVNGFALSSEYTDADTLSNTIYRSEIFSNFCRNDDFKRQFTITFMDLVNTSFTKQNVDSIMSEYIDQMAESTQVSHKRFFGSTDNRLFSEGVADIRDFLDNRKPYIVQYLKNVFRLEGTLAPIELEISDISSGKVILNTIEPAFNDDGKWHGEYYTDFPVTLTAAANDGYRFVRWEIADSSKKEMISEETAEIYIAETGTSVKAVYEKEEKIKP